jgi:hypothetical protein
MGFSRLPFSDDNRNSPHLFRSQMEGIVRRVIQLRCRRHSATPARMEHEGRRDLGFPVRPSLIVADDATPQSQSQPNHLQLPIPMKNQKLDIHPLEQADRSPLLTTLLLAAALTSVQAEPLAIVNGSFEIGADQDSSFTPITGWTDAGASAGFWLQDGITPGSFPQDPSEPQSGSLYLSGNRLAGNASSQPSGSTLSQVVVIDPTNLALVQAGGSLINLDFYYQDTDNNDSGEVTITFLDSSSATISSITTGSLPNVGAAQAAYNPLTAPWTAKNLSGVVPTNAESIRIDIITAPRLSGSATNVHFDTFSARIGPEDSDDDGLPDSYEQAIIDADPSDSVTDLTHVAGPIQFPTVTDFDNDGLSDADEYDFETDPLNPDSDDDGLKDGVETDTGFYNGPTDTGTDPLDPDWDFDGYNDGKEVLFNSDPLDDLSLPGSEIALLNPSFEIPTVSTTAVGVPVSGGSVTGWAVVTNEMWVIDDLRTATSSNIDPLFASEGTQFLVSNRLAPDPDALAAGLEGGNAAVMSANQDVDVSSFATEIDAEARTILLSFDWFDNDAYDRGKVTVHFLDSSGGDLGRYGTGFTIDNAGGWQTSTIPVYPPALTRTIRVILAAENRNDAGNLTGTGSARNVAFDNIRARLAFSDADSDLMADDWELDFGLNPGDPMDASGNNDADTLTNLQEFEAGTDPTKSDTDGDTYNDDVELSEGTDPLDAESFPIPASPVVTTLGFNLAGGLELSVSGMNPTKTYQLLRGLDLTGFPDVVESKVPAGESDVFTDNNPPTGKAFYIVEEVAP